jgi:hypothetical protein
VGDKAQQPMGMDQTIAGPMRAYLLGLLADDKASALEEEYFVNRAVLLRLQSEERALIADYLDGRLRSEEKKSFESRYLKMPELQRKVNEARSQHSAFRPAAKPWTRMMHPVAAGAAFAMVLCLGIGVWAFYHWEKKPAQQVAQVQPAEPTQGGTESAQATHGDTGGQNSLLPESNPVVSGGATLEFHMGQPLFIASSKSFLVGDRGPCAISNGDVLLRTASIPYENNTAYVSVVRSKPGDCKADTYLQVKVRYLEEMHQQFQERSEADMRRLQALANQASLQNTVVAVNTPAPVSASPQPVVSEKSKPVQNADSSRQSVENRPGNTSRSVEKPPNAISNARGPTNNGQHSTLESSPPPISYTMDANSMANSHSFSMLEKLQARYALTQGTDGCHVGNPEAVLTTQSPGGGMRVIPMTSSTPAISKCTNSFAFGKLNAADNACNGETTGKVGGWMSHIHGRVGSPVGAGSSKINDQAAGLQMDVVATGDKIYPTNLEVDENKNEVKFTFITCKQLGDQKNPYKGQIVFRFSSVEFGNLTRVSDVIRYVFRRGGDDLDYSAEKKQQGNKGGNQDNQSSVCNPEVGQTIKQVTDACGQPANQTKGATKTQFFYNQPKIKVIFVNGKVSDIE